VVQCIWSGLEFGQAGLLWVAYMFVWVVGLAGLGVQRVGKEWHFVGFQQFEGYAYVAGLSSDVVWLL